MNRLLVSAALALASLSSAHAATELVTNGSFEADAMGSGNWSLYGNLAGWAGAPNIELRNDVAGQAFDGHNFVELDTDRNSGMAQSISTHGGTHYTLSFAYAARPNTGDTNEIAVYWNGSLLDTLAGHNDTGSHAWSVHTYDVIGGAGLQSTVGFAARGTSDSFGGSLDAVSVTTAVPEPESCALLLGGLGAMAFVARRRRRA